MKREPEGNCPPALLILLFCTWSLEEPGVEEYVAIHDFDKVVATVEPAKAKGVDEIEVGDIQTVKVSADVPIVGELSADT
jgi:hypothetical protein